MTPTPDVLALQAAAEVPVVAYLYERTQVGAQFAYRQRYVFLPEDCVGMPVPDHYTLALAVRQSDHLAALSAAEERARVAEGLLREAQDRLTAETERCAQIANDVAEENPDHFDEITAQECAYRIRQGGTAS